MHEVGLMHEALRLALDHAKRAGATHLHGLSLRVGALSGVEAEALRLAFEVVSPGTEAEGAVLVIEEVPVECWCSGCEASFLPTDSVFRCMRCQRISDDIRLGREFDLTRVEFS